MKRTTGASSLDALPSLMTIVQNQLENHVQGSFLKSMQDLSRLIRRTSAPNIPGINLIDRPDGRALGSHAGSNSPHWNVLQPLKWQLMLLPELHASFPHGDDDAETDAGFREGVIAAAVDSLSCLLGSHPHSISAGLGESSTVPNLEQHSNRVRAPLSNPPLRCAWRSASLIPTMLSVLGSQHRGGLIGDDKDPKVQACCIVLLWQGLTVIGVAVAGLCEGGRAHLLGLAVRGPDGNQLVDIADSDDPGPRWSVLLEDGEELLDPHEQHCRLLVWILEQNFASVGITTLAAKPGEAELLIQASDVTSKLGITSEVCEESL